ncbi:MAG: bifunctional DNA-formamidopyrimidine glycosylase/DNA-(apurinic or apyrimidinic site) lyase [Gemmatimonadota bacterium]
MPELPEVETIARDLEREVSGSIITAVEVTKRDVLRVVGAAALKRRTTGVTITKCWRRAKLVVMDLSSGDRLVMSLRFTGGFYVDSGQASATDLHYSCVRWRLKDKRTLHYIEVRRLGTVSLMNPRQFATYVGRLGVEPLEPEFTPDVLFSLLRGSRQAVKKRIMDQTAVVGVGNIYANEALWRSRLDPSRASNKITREECNLLHRDIVIVLRQALDSRGTSFRDYRDALGERGNFGLKLDAYGREGEPCHRCGAKLIGTHEIDGRATVLCARCQS